MRRALVISVALCALVLPGVVDAGTHQCRGHGQIGGAVHVGCEQRTERQPPAAVNDSGGGRAVLDVLFGIPGQGPDGRTCYYLRWRWYPSAERAADAERRARQRLALVEADPLAYVHCDPRADESAPVVTPEQLVAEYWRTVQLPAPAPHVAPGWALPGKTAFLELGAPTTVDLAEDAPPFGRLALTVTSTYTVDWGDGTVTGPHSGPGGPWPDGDVTHVYQHAGVYEIAVTQQWSARWSLGGRAGTVGGVETVGRLSGFEVREVQALRNS